jgi:hypothetical protein
VKEKSKKEFESILSKKKQHHTLLGRTIAGKFNVNDTIKLELIELSEIYYKTIPKIMNG